jgi:hypothetical protein
MRIWLLCALLLIGCKDAKTRRVCVLSTATKEDAIACGTARYPDQCWEWVRKARCTKWRTEYIEWEHRNRGPRRIAEPCSATRGERREVCLREGWKEGTE